MSSVIAAPRSDGGAAASGRAGIVWRVRRRIAAHPDALVALALAALLVAVSFGAGSGSMLSRTTTA